MTLRALGLLVGLALLLFILPVSAQEVARSTHAEVQLVAEEDSVQPGRPLVVGLHFRLDPGWHTYWQYAGDVGLPTTVNWHLPPGFAAGSVQWPYPQKFVRSDASPALVSYGYEGEVLLPVTIHTPRTLKLGSSVSVQAVVQWLECAAVCLPGDGRLSLQLPVRQGIPQPSRWAGTFALSRSRLPITASDWRFEAVVASGDQIQLKAVRPAWLPKAQAQVNFYPAGAGLILAAPQTLTAQPDGFNLRLSVRKTPAVLQGVLFNPEGWRGPGSEKALAIALRPGPPAPAWPGWLAILASAFVGGVLLNLMPCVLPVLSLKVLVLVEQADGKARYQRWHGPVFTAGVLVSLWLVAGVLLLLRAGGEQLGWGFQLQSPQFVIAIAVVLFGFALNLFGLFEIGTGFTRLGALVPESGLVGTFLSGVLATTVATPCSAPFMSSALGFALTQPAPLALLVFTSLGVGLAAPYLVLSWAPALLRFVPKPGDWMIRLRQLLGFGLLGSVLWLAWVLGQQSGVQAESALLVALLLCGLGGWLWGSWGALWRPAWMRALSATAALSLVVLGLSFAWGHVAPPRPALVWEAYSPTRLAALQRAGQAVFVDFSAAWCLSCQVNERVALASPAVQAAFQRQRVVVMKADWTNRDPLITAALASFQRNSVPFYVLYRPRRDPQILPELLTPSLVQEALERAYL